MKAFTRNLGTVLLDILKVAGAVALVALRVLAVFAYIFICILLLPSD